MALTDSFFTTTPGSTSTTGGRYVTRSKSAYGSGGPGMFDVGAPPIQYRVFVADDGSEWSSADEFQKARAGAGSSGSGGMSGSSAPGGTAAYTAPKAVDRTNVYENRLLSLLDNPDSIANTGAYKFRFNQGQQALERSAAARGMSGSGNTLAALADYGQGMASQAYDTEANRLGGLTGMQKNYIRDLINAANTESDTANKFTLGNQQNAIEWNLGTERNSIARLAAENQGLSVANQIHAAKGAYSQEPSRDLYNGGTFGGPAQQYVSPFTAEEVSPLKWAGSNSTGAWRTSYT